MYIICFSIYIFHLTGTDVEPERSDVKVRPSSYPFLRSNYYWWISYDPSSAMIAVLQRYAGSLEEVDNDMLLKLD